jgi:hypothetical protein
MGFCRRCGSETEGSVFLHRDGGCIMALGDRLAAIEKVLREEKLGDLAGALAESQARDVAESQDPGLLSSASAKHIFDLRQKLEASEDRERTTRDMWTERGGQIAALEARVRDLDAQLDRARSKACQLERKVAYLRSITTGGDAHFDVDEILTKIDAHRVRFTEGQKLYHRALEEGRLEGAESLRAELLALRADIDSMLPLYWAAKGL